ncbi:MAG TPA: hypothetical protein VF062_01710 [Candidatus Limnocylindrales bacterium]
MIEILERLDVLAHARLDLSDLSLSGVPYGSRAADTVARDRIEFVSFSPIVRRTLSGTAIDSVYYGADGERLPPDRVVDSVIGADGVLHLSDKTSYKIVGGSVRGFAIYGADRGHLAHFGFLRSHDRFVALFGIADRVEESRTYGDLLGYWHHFKDPEKVVYWESWDEDGAGQLSSISLGD